MQTRGDGQQRFACACFAHQGDQGNGGIEQQIQREALFAVSRLDAAQVGAFSQCNGLMMLLLP